MKIHNTIYKVLILILIGIYSSLASDANAQVEGEWKYLSSFNPHTTVCNSAFPNHVRKIIDGNRYAYFLVHGRTYLHPVTGGLHWGTSGKAAAVLYRADKNQEFSVDSQFEMEAVASIDGIEGGAVNNAEYCIESGVLAIAYANGLVTLLYDNGKIVNIQDFKTVSIPGMKEIRNITFDTDGNRIYFAGSFGFFVVDAQKEEMTNICLSARPLDFAFRCGNRMIAIERTTIHQDGSREVAHTGDVFEASYEEGINLWSAFAPMEISAGASIFTESSDPAEIESAKTGIVSENKIEGAIWGVPFNENTFCVITKPEATRKVSVVRRLDNGEWALMYVMDQYVPFEKLYAFQMTPFEGSCNRIENGWGFLSGKNYWMFDRTVSPDLSLESPISVYLEAARINERLESAESGCQYDNRRFNSINGHSGWVYEPFKGFIRCIDREDTGKWAPMSAVSLPNAPVVGVTDNMYWDSETGLVVRQYGFTYKYDIDQVQEKDHISIRKDGVWKDFSMQRTNPELISGYFNPSGLTIDPLHPQYIYGGSRFCGVVRRNLEDPSDVLFLGVPGEGSRNANLPGFIPLFPEQPAWKGVCIARNPRFDEEGNMWLAFGDYSNDDLILYKWEKEAVAASLEANRDESKFVAPKSWNLGLGGVNQCNDYYPLKHESNRNLGLLVLSGRGNNINIVDFSQDAENPVVHVVDFKQSPENDLLFHYGAYSAFEDAGSGRVWIATMNGIVGFYPSEIAKGNYVFETPKAIAAYGVRKETSPLAAAEVYYLCGDEKGRLWAGTTGAGLFCLSGDGSEILAHFDNVNSPLPSVDVNGLCWDGSTHSLIVATMEGLYEFMPYDSMAPESISRVRIWPENIEPGYNGWVTISGVPDSMSLALADSNGNNICELPVAKDGMIQWDPRGEVAKPQSGKYQVVEKSTGRNLGEIIIY